MRLLFILIFSLPSISFANNFVAKSKLKNPTTIWSRKAKCEQVEGERCFSISGKDVRRFKVGFRSIAINLTQDCLDASDCQNSIDTQMFACPSSETPSFDDKANWPTLDFASLSRPANGFFLWCQKEILVSDSAGIVAADADDATKASEKAARSSKKNARDASLKQCIRVALKVADLSPGNATTSQLANRQNKMKGCLAVFMKEVLETRLLVNDL